MATKSLQWLALAMLLGAAVMALAADPSREEPSYGGGLKGNYVGNSYPEDDYGKDYNHGSCCSYTEDDYGRDYDHGSLCSVCVIAAYFASAWVGPQATV
jgi:hypothetical protein